MLKRKLVDILPYEKAGYFLVKREGEKLTRSVPLYTLPEAQQETETTIPATWEKDSATGKFRCSVCGEIRLRKGQKFCHSCGAPMSESEGV